MLTRSSINKAVQLSSILDYTDSAISATGIMSVLTKLTDIDPAAITTDIPLYSDNDTESYADKLLTLSRAKDPASGLDMHTLEMEELIGAVADKIEATIAYVRGVLNPTIRDVAEKLSIARDESESNTATCGKTLIPLAKPTIYKSAMLDGLVKNHGQRIVSKEDKYDAIKLLEQYMQGKDITELLMTSLADIDVPLKELLSTPEGEYSLDCIADLNAAINADWTIQVHRNDGRTVYSVYEPLYLFLLFNNLVNGKFIDLSPNELPTDMYGKFIDLRDYFAKILSTRMKRIDGYEYDTVGILIPLNGRHGDVFVNAKNYRKWLESNEKVNVGTALALAAQDNFSIVDHNDPLVIDRLNRSWAQMQNTAKLEASSKFFETARHIIKTEMTERLLSMGLDDADVIVRQRELQDVYRKTPFDIACSTSDYIANCVQIINGNPVNDALRLLSLMNGYMAEGSDMSADNAATMAFIDIAVEGVKSTFSISSAK